MARRVPTLIDTGPLVAILNKSDARRRDCEGAFRQVPAPLNTCWPVLTEAAYLLGESSPGGRKLLELVRSRALRVLTLDESDVAGIQAILAKYGDQGFQLADACLMHLADREDIDQVLTLDRRDFVVFRTSDGKALEILP